MVLTNEQRQEAVKYLTVNCDCWKGQDKLLANKQQFPDDLIVGLVKNTRDQQLVINAFEEKFGQKVPTKAMPAFIKEKVAPKRLEGEEGYEDAGKGDELSEIEPTLEVPDAEVGKTFVKGRREDNKVFIKNKGKPMTTNEWLANAPEEVQYLVNSSLGVVEEEKQRLIGMLVANVRDPKVKTELVKIHNAKKLPQLKLECSALPTYMQPVVNQGRVGVQRESVYGPSFLNDGDQVQNRQDDSDDILPITNEAWAAV